MILKKLPIRDMLRVITPNGIDRNSLTVCTDFLNGISETSIVNNSDSDIHVKEVHIGLSDGELAECSRANNCRQYIHWIDFSPNDGVKLISMPTEWAEVGQPSNMFTIISDDVTGKSILLGALPPYSDGFTWFDLLFHDKHKAGEFDIIIRMDFNCRLAAGKTLMLPPLVFMEGDSGEKLLENYAKLTFRKANVAGRKRNITGWSSWDYYAGAVTRNTMDENRSKCITVFGKDAEYMIIDDGYQNIWGNWDANWKFPEGLADYCSACMADGKKPGIWIAPLMVSVNSPLFRDRPEWFVVGLDGNVYEFMSGSWGIMAQLDPTIPEVQHHLREIFDNLREAGFEYYKIDFTQLLLEAGEYADNTIGKAKAYHILFNLIRDSIGTDAYLLSCGAPYEAVFEYVNAVRTGGDIHNYEYMAAQCARSLFGRLWIQESICNIDPDFLIVRCDETSDDKYFNRRRAIMPLGKGPYWYDGPEFSINGAKFWALAVYFAGGDMVLGDRIAGLNENGIEILRRVLRKNRQPAKWINQFDPKGQDIPVLLAEYQDRYEVGIFNISKSIYVGKIPVELPFAKDNAKDFWTGEKCQLKQIKLRPNESIAIEIFK